MGAPYLATTSRFAFIFFPFSHREGARTATTRARGGSARGQGGSGVAQRAVPGREEAFRLGEHRARGGARVGVHHTARGWGSNTLRLGRGAEAARALLYLAAAKVTDNAPDKSKFSAMAKRLATDSGSNVVNNALQLFGGYGYLKEYPIERFWRDLRVHSILEGTNQVMRMIVGREMLRQ